MNLRPVRPIAALICLSVIVAAVSLYRGRSGARPVRIGVNVSPPYSEIGADGKPHGFSVEVISEAARRRGIPIVWITANEGPDSALASSRVDVWPLVTVTQARLGTIFFSDPYLRTRFSLLVPGGSSIRKREDAAGRRISHDAAALNSQLAARFLPESTLIATPPGEEMKAVCAGTADGAFFEQRGLLSALLARPGVCRSRVLEILPLEGANFNMAIGSNRAGREAAKSLRAGITDLSRDGALDSFFGKWLRDTSDETRIVSELREANERSRLLFCGVLLLAVTLLLLVLLMYRRRLAQQAVKSAYDFASVALDSAGGLVLICDRQGRILRFNRACERASGRSLAEVRGRAAWELLVPDHEKAGVQAMFERLAAGTGQSTHEHHWETAGGRRLYSWSNTTLTNQNGRVDYIIATGIDITARQESEERLGYEATHDPLTGLANRRHFLRELDSAASATFEGAGFTVAIADLDRFKLINDTFGHAAGDAVLVFFARAILEELAPEDLGGRLGGDEFCLLLRGPFAATRIERIDRRLREHVFRSASGQAYRASAAFGLASPDRALTGSTLQAADLLAAADEALYQAKRECLRPLPHFEPDPRAADRMAEPVSAS